MHEAWRALSQIVAVAEISTSISDFAWKMIDEYSSTDQSSTMDWRREDDQPRLLRAMRDEYAVFCHFRACDLYNVWDYVWPSGERYPAQYFGICPRSI